MSRQVIVNADTQAAIRRLDYLRTPPTTSMTAAAAQGAAAAQQAIASHPLHPQNIQRNHEAYMAQGGPFSGAASRGGGAGKRTTRRKRQRMAPQGDVRNPVPTEQFVHPSMRALPQPRI